MGPCVAIPWPVEGEAPMEIGNEKTEEFRMPLCTKAARGNTRGDCEVLPVVKGCETICWSVLALALIFGNAISACA